MPRSVFIGLGLRVYEASSHIYFVQRCRSRPPRLRSSRRDPFGSQLRPSPGRESAGLTSWVSAGPAHGKESADETSWVPAIPALGRELEGMTSPGGACPWPRVGGRNLPGLGGALVRAGAPSVAWAGPTPILAIKALLKADVSLVEYYFIFHLG